MNIKKLYNTDNSIPCSEWVRQDVKGLKTYDYPQMKSSINISQKGRGKSIKNSLGYFHNNSNEVYYNSKVVGLYTTSFNGANGVSIIPSNFYKTIMVFTARKTIIGNWINSKDEYKKTPLPEL